jgi:catechol 2,3-dioxygenase-like lactoylglutathione lyase family enzyme
MSNFQGIDHIEFNVDDVEQMVAFYKLIGFVETRRTEHTGGSVELRFPGGPDAPILELNQSTKDPKGFQHVSLRVQDIDAAYAELSSRPGVKIMRPLGPPRPGSGLRVFNIEDPQGGKLQVSDQI